jgi:3-oxoacyl-[acyl-carrier-protein] synthase II
MSRRRVVVTGLGATTPIGGDVTTSWSALLAGTSGVRNLTEEWAQTLPVHFAARVAVEPAEQMERVELRRLDRSEQFALVASREAWKDAGSPEVDKERLGVVIASGIGGVTTLLDQYDILREKGARLVSPHTVPMLMPNGPAANVGLELQARAGVHTPVSACASGAEAIGYALEMIRNDRADIVVSGGVEAAIHAMPMSGFAAMKALSTRNDEPQRASRPYDLNRDGFVLGEGGGILVLEEYEHALARGAKIYCEIAGQGLTSDGYHIAAPDPDGAGVQRAVKLALRDSGLTTKDIVHLNAHATSTPAGDVAEANALRAALGADADHVAVSATKSMTGHLLGGAGAIESVFIVKTLQDRLAPPTINIDDLDPAVTVDVVRDKPRALPAGDIAALNDSFGFGGHNVVLVFKSI